MFSPNTSHAKCCHSFAVICRVLKIYIFSLAKPNVICTETTMTVEVEKYSYSGINESHLRLNDPSNTVCSLTRHSNSTHVVAVMPLNGCGTVIEVPLGHLFHYPLCSSPSLSVRKEKKNPLKFRAESQGRYTNYLSR